MTRFITLALLIPTALTAQQGTITYTYSQQYGFEIPEDWKEEIPNASTGTMVLHFVPTESRMTVGAGDDGASQLTDRWRGRLQRLKTRSASRGDLEVVRDTWVSFADGTAVETREFIGRDFRIAGSPVAYAWRLTSEQAEHLGHMVIKATAEQEGRSIEAWFTPEIPIPGGPASYGGLPGMILVLSLDGGRTQYFATEIALGEVEAELIRAPTDGDEVMREEYEAIVKEKLDELEQLYGRRGDVD
jgi:GLPGLI family protein